MVKADYTGSEVVVINSKNPTMIGLKGIVIRENSRSFMIITEKCGEENNGGN